MYPLILAIVFALMTVMMMPGRVVPFSELAFANPDAAADMGRAEVYAHNMAIFAEAAVTAWQADPTLIPDAPQDLSVVDFGRKAHGYLPVNYRPLLPWRVSVLRDHDRVDAVIIFVERSLLPARMHQSELAHGLRLTAGHQTPVGIVYAGRLGMKDITRTDIARKYSMIGNFPTELIQDGSVAIVVCIGNSYCQRA